MSENAGSETQESLAGRSSHKSGERFSLSENKRIDKNLTQYEARKASAHELGLMHTAVLMGGPTVRLAGRRATRGIGLRTL